MDIDDQPTPDADRHRGPVASVAPAGSHRGVSGAYDGAVRHFDLLTGRSVVLGHHDHLVNAVVVDAGGRLAASCSSDHSVALWDLTNGQRAWRREDHDDDVEAFAFLGDGLCASAGRDHRIVVRDLLTGEPVRDLVGHERDVLALAATPGMLISAGDDRTLRAWDPRTGEPVATWGPFSHESDCCSIDLRRRVASLGAEDGVIRTVSLDSGAVIAEIPAHASAVKALAFAPDGRLLSAGYDQTLQVRLPHVSTPELVTAVPEGLWERSVCWGAHPDEILGGTFDGTVLHWRLHSSLRHELGADGLGNPCINDLAVLGTDIAIASDDGVVRLVADGQGAEAEGEPAVVIASGVPSRRVLMNAVAVDRTDGSILTGAHDQRLTRWRPSGSALVPEASVHLGGGPINSIATAPDGQVFVACYDGTLVETNADLAVVRRHTHHLGPVKAVRLHPGGGVGASCSADGSIALWDVATGGLLRRLRDDGPIVNDLAFNATGDRLAAVGRDFAVTVFDLLHATPGVVIPLNAHSGKSIAFLSDDTVAVGDYWGEMVIVDTVSGATERSAVARNGLSALAVGGGRVLAGSYDGGLFTIAPDGTSTEVLRLMDQRPPRQDPRPRRGGAVPTSGATQPGGRP